MEVSAMLPIGPLMIEHRLIERMIEVIGRRVDQMEKENKVDPQFIDLTVDFIRTYADRCHHGKEEDILFRDLLLKPLSREHNKILEELIEEHRWGRETVSTLVSAKANYLRGEQGALTTIADCLKSLVNFYPKHIEKEDRQFFMPCMQYFSAEEKAAMLEEEWEFDRNLIHEKYRGIVARAEETALI
jgi:hemerythrin-like domain-containing protein